MMDVSMIFDIEKEGLATTIKQYTNDNFIMSYCEKLQKLSYPEDEVLIKMLLPKLLSWYDEGHIDNILVSEYVICKEAHIKTYRVLKGFIKEMGVSYVVPKKTAINKDLKNQKDPFVRLAEMEEYTFY
jgi:hypothetical protein